MVDDEEPHDRDADLTHHVESGDDPANPHVAKFVETGGHDERTKREQLVGDRIKELAQFRHLIVFACHPTIDLIGRRGDDEHDGGAPPHADVAGTPCTTADVESQEHDNEYDSGERHQVRR